MQVIKLLLLTLLCTPGLLIAQKAERVTITLHTEDGNSIETMMYYYPSTPWRTQKAIRTFDPALKDQDKIKGKEIVKYNAKDVVGFEMDGKLYESHKVTLVGDNDLVKPTSALPVFAFVELISDGAIKVYKGYGNPPMKAGNLSTEEINERFLNKPDFFVQKEGMANGKLKCFTCVTIKKWIADSQETMSRYEAGEFGNMAKEKKKGLIGKMASMGENNDTEFMFKVIEAYNGEMEGS